MQEHTIEEEGEEGEEDVAIGRVAAVVEEEAHCLRIQVCWPVAVQACLSCCRIRADYQDQRDEEHSKRLPIRCATFRYPLGLDGSTQPLVVAEQLQHGKAHVICLEF